MNKQQQTQKLLTSRQDDKCNGDRSPIKRKTQVNVLENESATLPVLSKSSVEVRLEENLRFEENLNHLHQNRNVTVKLARPELTSLILFLAFFNVIL